MASSTSQLTTCTSTVAPPSPMHFGEPAPVESEPRLCYDLLWTVFSYLDPVTSYTSARCLNRFWRQQYTHLLQHRFSREHQPAPHTLSLTVTRPGYTYKSAAPSQKAEIPLVLLSYEPDSAQLKFGVEGWYALFDSYTREARLVLDFGLVFDQGDGSGPRPSGAEGWLKSFYLSEYDMRVYEPSLDPSSASLASFPPKSILFPSAVAHPSPTTLNPTSPSSLPSTPPDNQLEYVALTLTLGIEYLTRSPLPPSSRSSAPATPERRFAFHDPHSADKKIRAQFEARIWSGPEDSSGEKDAACGGGRSGAWGSELVWRWSR